MELAEYHRMHEAESRHFWFRGSRAVVRGWLADAARGAGAESTLLDVGAGTGGMLESLPAHYDSVGVEYHAAGAAYCAQRGVRVVQGGLPHLPFADARFDYALSMDVFEHIEDDVAAMAEVHRVLRPGGRLITTVPALPWLWSRHDEALHHHRRYLRRHFIERLEAAGFRVHRCTYYNALLLPPIAAARVLGRLKDKLVPTEVEAVSDVDEVAEPFNGALAAIFGSERRWLKHVNFPLGASLIADCEAQSP